MATRRTRKVLHYLTSGKAVCGRVYHTGALGKELVTIACIRKRESNQFEVEIETSVAGSDLDEDIVSTATTMFSSADAAIGHLEEATELKLEDLHP